MFYSFYAPTRVRFGIHAIENLQEFRDDFSGRRALLITSRSHADRGEVIAKIINQLKGMGITTQVFGGIHAEPASDLVDKVAEERRLSECDLIVALGGGSVIDVAKFVAMMATNGGKCAEYEAGRPVEHAPLPLVVIPTTAGSGSEVTPYGVITNSRTRRKFTVTSTHFFPYSAVIDPALTVSQPRAITVASGLDAWIHALEAHLSVQTNPMITPLIERVLRTVPPNLSVTLINPDALNMRAMLSLAATQSGFIISHLRTGLVHTMSVTLSAHVDLPHGLLNAVILPHVLEFNLESYRRERLDSLRETMITSCRVDSQRVNSMKLHSTFSEACGAPIAVKKSGKDSLRNVVVQQVKNWLKSLGVPVSLSGFKLDQKIIPSLVDRVRQDGGLPTVNPRPISDDDLTKLFGKVLFDE